MDIVHIESLLRRKLVVVDVWYTHICSFGCSDCQNSHSYSGWIYHSNIVSHRYSFVVAFSNLTAT